MGGPPRRGYGVVVGRGDGSGLLYVPVRRASLAPICCLNVTVATSLDAGAEYVLTTPRPCSGWGSAKGPLSRWPGLLVLGSATLSVASPAVETTVAVVEALYSFA